MVRQINVQQLAEKLAAGEVVCLVDVHQPWEHDTAALPGSQLVPLDQLTFRAGDIRPAAGVPVVVYCHHGIRSLSAAALLEHLGFPNVLSLAGGIDAWSLFVDPKMPRCWRVTKIRPGPFVRSLPAPAAGPRRTPLAGPLTRGSAAQQNRLF